MKFTIGYLQNLLNGLNLAYDKFVINGTVEKESPSSIENRNKAKELEEAIKILENKNDSAKTKEV